MSNFGVGAVLLQLHPAVSLTLFQYVELGVIAFAAGALNAVAGGGSFFSFPALLSVHMPPINANATNSVALWPGQLGSIVAFRRELRSMRRLLPPAMACAALGGIVGAKTLLLTGQDTFLKLVPWLLLFATVLYALGGPMRNWLERLRPPLQGAEPAHLSFTPAMFFWLIIVCFYIGYFGAGAGFLIITVLTVVGGMPNLNEVNALKMVLNSVANGVAVVTFIVAGAVYWKECLIMLLFAAAGGYFSAHYSRKMDPRYLRWFIIVSGLTLSIYFFHKTW